MAISCVTDAVLGLGSAMAMAYMKNAYIKLKVGDTLLPKSIREPCNFAWAKIPKMGMATAESPKPIVTTNHWSPELKPSKGGKIRLPAPKKRENRAKAVIRVSFFLNMNAK